MGHRARGTQHGRWAALGLTTVAFALASVARAQASESADKRIRIDARVGLAGLMTATELQMGSLAEVLRVAASTVEARTGEWAQIEPLLRPIQSRSIPALVWFALPDGTYWSVNEGLAKGNLADRPYFPSLLAGKDVLGSLVYSRATGRCSGIVAVPVLREGAVVGVLGASVFLEQLAERLVSQLEVAPPLPFFAVDATPLVALEWKAEFILHDPKELGSPSLNRAIQQMLASEEGTVDFRFRDARRTLYFRKSKPLGWWFAFGVVRGGASGR